MRAGLSAIQQTLTPDSAAVLTQSISEAGRRHHGQTTPLHVASTLLSSASGFLRHACIRSHPNSSHPLQCRALELCFSVALERLPSSTAAPPPEPPLSNALTAALKRAQAHQRRGCPEQQQQPLLALKVELDQLVISILDDPSVSRVMREAGFSSPAVKSAIEQSLTSSSSNTHLHHHHKNAKYVGVDPRMLCNPYLNPRLDSGSRSGGDEIAKVVEIMMRGEKRNPILVGDSEPEAVLKEFLKKVENGEFGSDGVFKNVGVVSMERGVLFGANGVKELGDVIESRIGIGSGGVIVDLGDLKWLVEHQHRQQVIVSENGRALVVEMARLLARFNGDEGNNSNSNKVWLIGVANCETYLRCQVYYSTMENDWDLQAVPMPSRSPFSGMFPRLGTERYLSNPVEPLLNPVKAVHTQLPSLTKRVSENYSDPSQRTTLCPRCSENYEKELETLVAIDKSFSEAKQQATQPSLPLWLQKAKLNAADAKIAIQSQEKDLGVISEQEAQELLKKWRETCLHLHSNFHHQRSRALSTTTLYDPNLLTRPIFQPNNYMPTTKPLKEALQLNINKVTTQTSQQPTISPPESPVQTDLVLGRKGPHEKFTDNKVNDFSSCISSEVQTKLLDKFANAYDADNYKKLLKRLMEKAWWQREAASSVASAITRCKLGGGKRRLRGDIWLLFAGPDRVGKKKMALVLAEKICGASLITISLSPRKDSEESDVNFRGKTVMDRIMEALRENPFSVIMLEDIDEADVLVRGNIKRGIERGRLTDSHSREVSLGNSIFVLTGDWSTNNHEPSRDGRFGDFKKIASVANGSWQLGLIVKHKSAKRQKPRKEVGPGLSLDLNLAVSENEYDKTDGSHDSSDLTVDHDDELISIVNRNFSITSVPNDLLDSVDESIVFKPFDTAFALREIKKTIALKFSMIVDENLSLEVEDDVLEKILGGLLHDRTSLEEWIENVLGMSFDQLKQRLPSDEQSGSVVRLVVESDFGRWGESEDWLPNSILV